MTNADYRVIMDFYVGDSHDFIAKIMGMIVFLRL